MRTIARTSTRKIAAIKATIVKATMHSLAGNFESVEVPVDAVLAAHQDAGYARLYDNLDGTYTVHVHSNLWYKMFTQEALEIGAARAEERAAHNAARIAQAPVAPVRTAGPRVDITALAERAAESRQAPVKEAITPAFVTAKQVPAAPYLGNECECGHLRGDHYLRQHCDVAFCDCQAFESRALTVTGHVTGVVAAVRPVGPNTAEIDIEQADGTVTTVRNSILPLKRRKAMLFATVSDRALIDALPLLDTAPSTEETRMVRAWTIEEIEHRYPEAGAAAAAAFDDADRVLVEEDRVVEVDYVAVLLAALPSDIR